MIVLILVNSMILGTSMILRTTNESKQAMQEKTNSKIVAEITSKDSKITENEVNKIETLEDVSSINRIGRQEVFPNNFAPVTLNTSTNEENLKIALLSYDDLEKDSPFSEMQYRLASGDYIKREKKGTVLCNGEDITKKGLNYHRKHNISLVFQNYNLIDYLTTVENVKLGGSGNAEKLLEEVGIGKEYWQRNVLQLSGGQQQRVAIARALASDAHVLLADEPTGNLDETTADEIIALLKKTAHELGKCVVVVTHSKHLAEEADEILEIKNGAISFLSE